MPVPALAPQPQALVEGERRGGLLFRCERYQGMPSIFVESIGGADQEDEVQTLFKCMIDHSQAMMTIHNYDRDPNLLRPGEFMEDVNIVSVHLCFHSEQGRDAGMQRVLQAYRNALAPAGAA